MADTGKKPKAFLRRLAQALRTARRGFVDGWQGGRADVVRIEVPISHLHTIQMNMMGGGGCGGGGRGDSRVVVINGRDGIAWGGGGGFYSTPGSGGRAS